MLDAIGVMAWFPFSTGHVSVGAYAYAGDLGRLTDAHAYYTSLGGAIDLLCAVLVLLSRRPATTGAVNGVPARCSPTGAI
jgi:hypothetical protein